jgi:hypothetical protein
MFERLKLKVAARRAERAKRARRNSNRPGFWACVWYVICWPFRKIWQFICWLWRLICGINVIGLLNLVLLVAIIVLCSMLIIDIINCHKKPVVIVTDPVPASTISKKINVPVVAEPITKPVSTSVEKSSSTPRKYTLPVSHNRPAEPIRVVRAVREPVTERQTARVNNTMYGDVIIDSRGAAMMLNNGYEINGNLYLQNMRKYVLPCDIKITGNMFVRDVNMLQFCGKFEIAGNIYVTPTSSFGPIPPNAYVGGQVIL